MKEGMILRKDAIEILLGAAMDYGLLYGQKEPRDEMIRSMIRRIEDLEPVGEPSGEVIRCKDCKHWLNREYHCVSMATCSRAIGYFEADDYCSRAERRDKP